MTLKPHPFDPAEFLDAPEAVAEYLAAAFESGDHAVIADAPGRAECHNWRATPASRAQRSTAPSAPRVIQNSRRC